ncbi:MAG: alpha/beta hydrolase [Silvanigrellaceae bacterium]|nr:alpha/beta hydrolase [Silvanigrellaceae bacterium]
MNTKYHNISNTNNFHFNSELQYLKRDDAKIAFDFYPAQNNCERLLILVNGYQRTRLDFRAFRKRLHSYLPTIATIALDNRYCGQSEVFSADKNLDFQSSPEALLFEMARDVVELGHIFCNLLSLSRFSLLGISMGGMIAQCVAAQEPQAIEHLALVSTTAGGAARVFPSHISDPKSIKYQELTGNNEISEMMERYFAKRFLEHSPLLFDMFVKTMQKQSHAQPKSSENAKKQFYASLAFDGTVQISKIKAKTCIFSGDEDRVIPLENSLFLKKAIPFAEFKLYKETGHLLLIEEPEHFTQDVAEFLKSN